MKLNIDTTTIADVAGRLIKIVPGADPLHIGEALAAGLGYPSKDTLDADAKADGSEAAIDDKAFSARLAILSGKARKAKSILTRVAVEVAPGSLIPEDHDEGKLVALAVEVERVRGGLEEDEDGLLCSGSGPVTAISMTLTHEGGNDFDCEVSAYRDLGLTVMIEDDEDRAQDVLRGDHDALKRVLAGYDREWIENYDPEDVPGNERGEPEYEGGCYYNSTGVEVWPDRVRVVYLPTGGGKKVDIHDIDGETYAEIEKIMACYHYGDANRVVAVLNLLDERAA